MMNRRETQQSEYSNRRRILPMTQRRLSRIALPVRIVFSILPLLLFEVPTHAQPFLPGERLEYALKWGVIPAGEAVLETMPVTDFEGAPAQHFVMTVRTNSFVDKFYKVRDRIDAYADVEMKRSLHYRKQQKEGKRERDEQIHFDWDAKTAQFSNFGDRREAIPIESTAFDPLSAMFYTRLFPLKEGMNIESTVTDGKKAVIGRAKILKKETIVIEDRSYETFLMEPELEHIGGVFEKSRGAKIEIWVTADDWRIPVRVRSKVAVGSFIAELSRARRGEPSIPPEAQQGEK